MSYLMLLLALALLALFVWAFSNWQKQRGNIALLLITIMLSLQWVDSLIFGLGRWIGEGDLLELLSRLRTAWFFVTSPLLLLLSFFVLRNAEFAWLRSNILLAGLVAISVAYMVIDGAAVLVADFYPVCAADTLRYVMKVPPDQICPGDEAVAVDGYFSPMLIASTAAVLLTGIILWIWRGWPWLGAASILFFGGFVLMPTDVVGPFLQFPLDGLMTAAIVLTTIQFSPDWKRSPSA